MLTGCSNWNSPPKSPFLRRIIAISASRAYPASTEDSTATHTSSQSEPARSTSVGGAVVSNAAYDQVGFQSRHMKDDFTGSVSVFDFDRAPFFRAAWERSEDYFFETVKRHIADHRPLWIQFDT